MWELVWTCFRKLVESHTYQDKWICNKTLIRLLRTQSPSLTNAIGFNLRVLNRALSSHSVEAEEEVKVMTMKEAEVKAEEEAESERMNEQRANKKTSKQAN